MSETISSGITFTIPSTGEVNWGPTVKTAFTEISSHDHTGSGNGVQLGTSALQSDSVTGAKIRLANDQYLRARNAANSADIDILKVNSSDKIVFGNALSWTTYSLTLSGGGTLSLSGISVGYAKYIQLGKIVLGKVQASFTLASGTGAFIIVPLPVTAVSSVGMVANSAYLKDNAGLKGTFTTGDTTNVHIYAYNAANLTTGAGCEVGVTFLYEAA